MAAALFVLVRALTYAAFFVGLLLVFVPARLLERAGISAPPSVGALQIGGMIVGAIGAAIAAWCILTFVFIGNGTAAPFDPPRRLVVRGPYRYVRNPMYIGAGLALIGAALAYRAWVLLAYLGVLWLATHALVVFYEEPTLRRMFDGDYEAYCRRVARWLPHL